MYYNYYLKQLGYPNIPEFLKKYLNCPSLQRLKQIDYFCGMNHSSTDVYDFREQISRYDHSLSVALLVYKLTKNKVETIAGLFHDIATPCFSHVIDYMNKDYVHQESTEEYTAKIIANDEHLKKCLEEDEINITDIIDFKKYPIVDNKRPKVCADRIDGVILTGLSLTQNINKEDIKAIVDDITIFKNELDLPEIGFSTEEVARKVFEVSETIDKYFHSKEDNYMMELLADITRIAIAKGYINYDDLYAYTEDEIFNVLDNVDDKDLLKRIDKFKTIKKIEITVEELSDELNNVKPRDLNPLVNGKRLR